MEGLLRRPSKPLVPGSGKGNLSSFIANYTSTHWAEDLCKDRPRTSSGVAVLMDADLTISNLPHSQDRLPSPVKPKFHLLLFPPLPSRRLLECSPFHPAVVYFFCHEWCVCDVCDRQMDFWDLRDLVGYCISFVVPSGLVM